MNELSLRRNLPDAWEELAQMFFENQAFAGIRLRYIELEDDNRDFRRAWLAGVVYLGEPLRFAAKPEVLLSRALSDFDVLLIGGDDAASMGAFMMQHRALMFGKVSICLCTASSPDQRAHLINSGFDAAVDPAEIHQLEFLARVYAIWRRYRMSEVKGVKALDLDAMVDRVADSRMLSPKQRAIVRLLLQMPGHEADYATLCATAGKQKEPIGLQNLKVLISQLRRLLRPGVQIVHDPGCGFSLVEPADD